MPSWVLPYGARVRYLLPYKPFDEYNEFAADNAGLPYDVLAVRISSLGVIKQVMPYEEALNWKQAAQQTINSWLSINPRDDRAARRAFYETMFLGSPLICRGGEENLYFTDKCERRADDFLDWLACITIGDDGSIQHIKQYTPEEHTSFTESVLSSFYRRHFGDNVFAMLEDGRFGTFAQAVRPGDTVPVMQGCPCPVALRRHLIHKSTPGGPEDGEKREEFKLLGSGLMHGLMTGEPFAAAQWRVVHLV